MPLHEIEFARLSTSDLPWHGWAPTVAVILLAVLALFTAVALACASGKHRVPVLRLVMGNTLRGRLISGLAMVAVLPGVALTLVLAHNGVEHRQRQLAERLQNTADAVAGHLDAFIDTHRRAVASAAASAEDGRSDARQLRRILLTHHRIYDDFLTMLVTDASGKVIGASRYTPYGPELVSDLAGHPVADREYFAQPMRNGHVFVSDVFRGRGLGNDPIVAISAPYHQGAVRAGVIEGSLDLKSLAEIEQEHPTMKGAALVIVDAGNRILHASEGTGYARLDAIAPLSPEGATLPLTDGVVSVRDARTPHDPRVGAIASARAGWRVILHVPATVVAAAAWSGYKLALLWLSATILIAIVLAMALARQVTRPLDELRGFVSRLSLDGADEAIAPPQHTMRELNDIFAAIQQRSQHLRATYRRLDRSIETGEKLRRELNRSAVGHAAAAADKELLEQRNQELDRISKADALTGIGNRRLFDEFLERVWAHGRRNGTPVTVLLVDVDHFKGYNDRYGHQAGDECLVAVADALSRTVHRPLDLVARYGGEEFAIVLAETPSRKALTVAENARNAINTLALENETAPSGRVSVSIGVAGCVPSSDQTSARTLELADRALYYAKQKGRDRIAYANREVIGIYDPARDPALREDSVEEPTTTEAV